MYSRPNFFNMRKLSIFLLLSVLAFSCSKDKDPEPDVVLSDAVLKLNYDKTHQYTLTKGTETVTGSTFKWSSSDTLIGVVNQSGKFTARRIGTTTVKAISSDGKATLESRVTIDPYSTLCIEPFKDFKATQAAIKGKEKRTVVKEDTATIAYTGENAKIRGVQYFFTKNALQSSILLFTESDPVLDEAVTFLSERYEFLGEENGIYYLSDGKVVVGFLEDINLGIMAFYIPYEPSGLRTALPASEGGKILFKSKLRDIKAKFRRI